MKISALILAAGKGKRIGKPKLTLELGGKSFLNIIAEKIQNVGIEKTVCIVSEDMYQWATDNVPELVYTVNPNPEEGMISSVFYGLQKIKKCDAVLVIPVDHPFVSEETYKLMVDAAEKNTGCVIKPEYKGKSGHPVLIPDNLFEKILEKDFLKGLDSVIKESEIKQLCIHVNDPGVIKNINTTEDLIQN